MKILVTGGLGYIGSHTVLELIAAGYEPVIIDSLANSNETCLHRISKLSGKKIPWYKCDVRDRENLREIFKKEKISGVIHFAALKAVGESVEKPLMYYENNVYGSIVLLEEMERANVKKFVFSSSATVYGDPASLPIKEGFPTSPTNPYGRTKLMVEEIGRDIARQNKDWKIVNLRYFNPVGAHPSGEIGEDPAGFPNNLMPYISQVAVGKLDELRVFGNDWSTKDGTGVRDYIHVVDLAKGHIKALQFLESNNGEFTFNLGTGTGYSVLEMIKAFEQVSNRNIPYKVVNRRSGDIASCYADPQLAAERLGWKAELGLKQMCEDAWRWQSNNPRGFQ